MFKEWYNVAHGTSSKKILTYNYIKRKEYAKNILMKRYNKSLFLCDNNNNNDNNDSKHSSIIITNEMIKKEMDKITLYTKTKQRKMKIQTKIFQQWRYECIHNTK